MDRWIEDTDCRSPAVVGSVVRRVLESRSVGRLVGVGGVVGFAARRAVVEGRLVQGEDLEVRNLVRVEVHHRGVVVEVGTFAG